MLQGGRSAEVSHPQTLACSPLGTAASVVAQISSAFAARKMFSTRSCCSRVSACERNDLGATLRMSQIFPSSLSN
jgi:hypothetical protein